MRRHAKASSAGSITHQARGPRLLALAVAALALLLLAPLAQAKVVVGAFGPAGTLGGQFGTATGGGEKWVAVNTSGVGVPAGTLYAVDTANNRVERLSANGAFQRAWGFNVAGRDERQLITVSGASGGTFTLGFGANTTAPISYSGATAPATVQSALTALASVGAGNVTVSGSNGGPWTVRFTGTLGGTDVADLVANGAALTGSAPAISVATTETGSGGSFAGFEICTAAAQCQEGTKTATTANGGQLGTPQGIAVNQANGHVYVAEAGNRRVQEFDADGNFVRAWGADVISSGATGTGNLNGTATVASLKATNKAFSVGQVVTSSDGGIPPGTTVTAVTTGAGASSTLTLSQSATTTATGVTIAAATGASNVAANERQTLTLSNPTAGTFTLTIPARQGFGSETTASIPFNASASVGAESVKSKLEAKGGMSGNVEVTGPDGGPYTVEFKGALGDTNVAQMTAASSGFTIGTGSQLNCTGGPVNATTGLAYQWLANGASLGSANGAQTSTYTVQAGDAGKAIQCQVTATNSSGGGGAVQTSAATVIVPVPSPAPPTPPASIAVPGLVGSLAVGSTPSGVSLTCNAGTWTGSPTSYTYQWYRNGQPIGSPTTTASTTNNYTVTTADLAAAASFQCAVTGTNAGGAETRVSANRETSPAPSPAAPAATATLVLPAATVTTAGEGASAFEICEVAGDCKTAAAAGTNGGQFGTAAAALVLDPANNVWVSDASNRRLQKFDASGNFLAVYGHNVNGGGTVESCASVTPGVCKAGTQGSAPGQFTSSPFFFDLDSAGNLYVDNGGNKRVERFAGPAMTSASTFASLPTLSNTDAMLALPGGHLLVTLNQSPERQLLELDSSGNPVETSLAGVGLGAVYGLARNPANGRIYLGTNNAQASILFLEDGSNPPPPGVTVDPIVTKGPTTATFTGTVDPQGATVSSCSFQYSTDQASWTTVPVAGCSSLAPGGGAQAVSANATGLVPNTQYFVRVAVNRLFIPGTSFSTAQAFTTDAAAPVVSNVGAIEVQDVSARLVGTIDPRHSATSYVFQYGTTPALGSSTDPVSVGSAASPQVISQVLDGLDPDTTYRFKLAATNSAGTVTSEEKTLKTRTEPFALPDHRAYEQVSPVDKNGGDVDGALALVGPSAISAWNGEAVNYCANAQFGDPAPTVTFTCAEYVSRRGDEGWSTMAMVPNYCTVDLGGTSGAALGYQDINVVSPEVDRAVILRPEGGSCSLPPLDPAAPLPAKNLYLRNLLPPFGSTLLAPQPPVSPEYLRPTGVLQAASDDFGHLVYRSTGQQTPDAPAGTFDKVFDWHDGSVSLVSKDPSGAPFATPSEAVQTFRNGVSSEGDRIFFQNPVSSTADPFTNERCLGSACEIYLREDDAATYDVSASECTSSCGASSADLFRMATPDGSKAFFTTAAKLTDDDSAASGDDLYMYTHSANPAVDKNLTLLSPDDEPADGISAGVRAVFQPSDDGDTVFFVATGQIVPAGPTGAGLKLYRWRWNGGSPEVEYLATLASGDNLKLWEQYGASPGNEVTYRTPFNRWVTPDGSRLMLLSRAALDPLADYDSDRDVYLWDEAHGFRCVSCQLPGVPSKGDASTYAQIAHDRDTGVAAQESRIFMSDDGSRVVFGSGDALVPSDTNGSVACPPVREGHQFEEIPTCQDVYEWHDGTVSLISSGKGDGPAKPIGISKSGRDVFFITREKLVGWDTDNNTDVYDARIGGGFPEPPPTGARCEGEACRTASAAPPPPSGAGSAVFQGSGNSQGGSVSCPKGSRKVTRASGQVGCKKKQGRKHRKHKRHQRAANHNRRTAR